MKGFAAVFKRELKSYFSTPLAYLFLMIFLLGSAILTFMGDFFEVRHASLLIFFDKMPILFIFLAPALAMRLWAEERRTNSIELLFTLPVSPAGAVLGKFLACWAVLALALVLTCPMVITVCYLGDPDPGPILTGYLGSLLLAGMYLAIGSFFSCLTRNQVIAFVLGVAACAVFFSAGSPYVLSAAAGVLPQRLVEIFESMSFQSRFESFQRGAIELQDVAFFALLAAGWLWANMVALKERMAAG